MTVLVVGAGPTGLVAALTLRANGVPCRVIDKRPGPGRSSRALGLQARSMEVLAGLGVAGDVEQVAYRLSGAAIMRGDKPLVNLMWVPPESRYPYTYVVPQTGLEEILCTRLEGLGVMIERGVELAGMTQDDSGVTATLSDGHTIAADWLIGADGASSRVREVVGIGFPQRVTGEIYYLADVSMNAGVDLGDSAMWLGPHGPLMLMRLPGGRHSWRVFIDMSDTARKSDLPTLTKEVLSRLLANRGPHRSRVESLQWTSVFRTRVGLSDAYHAGRVFLAGDAVHTFPPFGGQGMNLGIQDAVNLAWRLSGVAHGAPQMLLNDYERERRPVAAATIRDVETRRRLYALRNPLARWARDLLLQLGGGIRGAARRASLQNSQLATSYRGVVAGGDSGPRPRPGDRAPDGPFLDGTLHDLISPDHATLLLFDTRAADATVRREPALCTAVITADADPGGRLREEYGIRGEREYVLVRPDGHVVMRGTDPAEARRRVADMVGTRAGA